MFAIGVALTTGRESMQLFSVIVAAVITGTDGGTIRYVLLAEDRPIFYRRPGVEITTS